MFLRSKLKGFNHLAATQGVRLKETAFFGIVVGNHGNAATREMGILLHDAARDIKQGIRIGEKLLEFPTAVS